MGSAVQYRDLPGGPAELKFCDELSRFCLCTNCGMLSMSMLQDTNRHMFCETCLVEASEKHHREHIYCKFENNHVSIFEMFEAIDLITVIRDQYVMCPNTRCATALTLGELKKHYTQCQPTVTCWTCDRQVETADWDKHIEDCNKPGAGRTPQKATKETQVRPKYGVLSPGPSPSVNMDSNRNNSGAYGSMNTASVLHQAQMLPPANEGPELTTQCPYCARKVKEKNLENHVTKCQKAPLACVYCEKEFSREETKSHLAVCERNPDNVPQKVPEKREKALNKQPTCPPQAPGGNRLSYADVAKTGTAAGRNPATGPRQHSQGTQQKATAQVGRASSKGASMSCPVSTQGEVSADSPVWLQYLSSGDLPAAFAAFQESLSGKKRDETFLYTEFTAKFVDSSCCELVKDLLEEPCRTQPLDCLMVALFARKSFPPKVWTKNKHDVTWEDVLKYLPYFLVSRLQKRKVMPYFRKFPVFLDDGCTSNEVETSSGIEELPHKDSHCTKSTNPAAAASDVAGPPVGAKAEPYAPDLVKGNRLDGGQATAERRPPVHAGEKRLPQLIPNAEVEVFEREKCHDGEKHPTKVPNTRGKNSGPPLNQNIECTQREPSDDHMQPATDQARFPTMPSRLDTETSGKKNSGNIFNPPQSTACKLDPTHEQQSLEELGALLTLEVHSKQDVKSLNCETHGSDLISFGSADEGDFLHTEAKKEASLKAESSSTSLYYTALKEGGELALQFQSQNVHTLNITRKDSGLSTVQEASLSSAAGDTMQAENLSNEAHALLHGEGSDQAGYKTPSTENEPVLELEHQTRDGHPEIIRPEEAPCSIKCKAYRSEASSFGDADENNLFYAATNSVKAPKAGNNSSSVGDRALIEDMAVLAAQRQFQNDHVLNINCKERELSARLKPYVSSSTEATMQADGCYNAAHVVSSTEADALPVQKTGSTEHATSSTKKERFRELTHQARTVQKSRFVADSAPNTAYDMARHLRYDGTNTGRLRALRATFEPSPPEVQCLQARSESVASMNNGNVKEEVPSDAENEQYFTGRKPDLEDDDVVSKLSRLSISIESRDEPTTLTSDQSTYSELRHEIPLQDEHYQGGGRVTEGSAPPESRKEPPRSDTHRYIRGRSNSDSWFTWV